MIVDERELKERAATIERLIEEIEACPDPAMRAIASRVIGELLVLYGEGLARMLVLVREHASAESAANVLDAFGADELVAHLLMLHELHPVDVETRVTRALDEVRPYLRSHGGEVEFLGVEDGVARLRLQGSCHGCPSSTVTLKLAIEEAVGKAAPDLVGIDAEGVTPPPPARLTLDPASGIIPLTVRAATPAPSWLPVNGIGALAGGEMERRDLAGVPVLFLKLGETLYAYRDACPECDRPLAGGTLVDATLICAGCGLRFDIREAGRSLDGTARPLSPVPLLERDGVVTVALNGK